VNKLRRLTCSYTTIYDDIKLQLAATRYEVVYDGVIDVNKLRRLTCSYTTINDEIKLQLAATRYRVAKTHRIPYLYRSLSAKAPYI